MIDAKLEKLRANVSYYEWKYESCHRFWKNEYLTEIKKAKAKLKEYKAKHYPEIPLYYESLVLPVGIEPTSTALQTAAMTTSAKVALG